MEHAAVWGIVVGLLNLVPYVGSMATAGALALAAFLQFDTLGMGLAVGGVSLAINTLEGNLLTSLLTGRASRHEPAGPPQGRIPECAARRYPVSPLVIFIGVLAFGWLWGLWGLLLGAPLLMATKVVCDHVDGLKPVGELLSA
jgi:predicted PurR-regulated permease PerM